jgi:tRNA threonylcarbamoyladenosine biosynthesis protein TsaE
VVIAIIEERREFLSDAGRTLAAGGRLVPGLVGGMVVTLSGELGAGKTTLVRGMLRRMGWAGPVKSPTYTLVEHYALSSLYFYHFDFYRFGDSAEWDSTGFSEYFRPDALCVVEWPQRVATCLTQVDLTISLKHLDSGRELALVAWTPAGSACLTAYAATTP